MGLPTRPRHAHCERRVRNDDPRDHAPDAPTFPPDRPLRRGRRGACTGRLDAAARRPLDRDRSGAGRLGPCAGPVRPRPGLRPRDARLRDRAVAPRLGAPARPLARHARRHCAALAAPLAGRRRAAVRRRRRVPVLAGILDPLQLHRRRLPRLHPRGDRQHPAVVPGAAGPGGDIRDRAGDRPRVAPPGAAGRHPDRRARTPAAGRPRVCAARAQHRRGQRRPDERERQCLCRRTVRQRPVHLRCGVPAQRARLRPLLPDAAAGPGRRDPDRPRRRTGAAVRGAEAGRGRGPGGAVGPAQASAAQRGADLGGEPVGRVPRRLRQRGRAHAQSRPAGGGGSAVHAVLRHRHPHGARPRGALAGRAAGARAVDRPPARQRAPRDRRRVPRAPGLPDQLHLRRVRLLRQHERVLQGQRLRDRRPQRFPVGVDRVRERLGRGRRGAVRERDRACSTAPAGAASRSSPTS